MFKYLRGHWYANENRFFSRTNLMNLSLVFPNWAYSDVLVWSRFIIKSYKKKIGYFRIAKLYCTGEPRYNEPCLWRSLGYSELKIKSQLISYTIKQTFILNVCNEPYTVRNRFEQNSLCLANDIRMHWSSEVALNANRKSCSACNENKQFLLSFL